ncbi:MAG: deoxyribodipyrimidine photo-lyase [Geodermatophilaceae bacterium]
MTLPAAGEQAALQRWNDFRDERLTRYAEDRNRPDLPATSRLSAYLRWGCLHPRTPLADLKGRTGKGAEVFGKELAWREFYADVLFHRPDSAREHYLPRYKNLKVDTGKSADARFTAWTQGRTGYPIVDAGMRQLLSEAWIHNRIRMVVASFLVKDLHLGWKEGARHFMRHLVDGDLASNQHGWQWTAGSGTDASPFYRVFNPVKQGQKFDPDGDYVRRYVPELRGIEGAAVHTPWELADPRRVTRSRSSTTMPSGRRRWSATRRSRHECTGHGGDARRHGIHRARGQRGARAAFARIGPDLEALEGAGRDRPGRPVRGPARRGTLRRPGDPGRARRRARSARIAVGRLGCRASGAHPARRSYRSRLAVGGHQAVVLGRAHLHAHAGHRAGR